MSILDSLNPINLAKKAAESLVDSVLPDDLKAVGTDVVDAALDVVSGNYAGLGNDVGAFLHDAETAMGPLTTLAGALAPPALATEPDAPPASDTVAGNPKTATAAAKAATATSTSPTTNETLATPAPLATATGTTDTSALTPATTSQTATMAASADSPATVAASPTATAADKTDSAATSKTKSATTKTTASSDAKDITKFFAQSDTDLMAAVRDGKLPDAVKNDPASMQRLQLRMNEISEMNQLISQMLAAMHDMNKAVIQNIRA